MRDRFRFAPGASPTAIQPSERLIRQAGQVTDVGLEGCCGGGHGPHPRQQLDEVDRRHLHPLGLHHDPSLVEDTGEHGEGSLTGQAGARSQDTVEAGDSSGLGELLDLVVVADEIVVRDAEGRTHDRVGEVQHRQTVHGATSRSTAYLEWVDAVADEMAE